mgnify:FL=1
MKTLILYDSCGENSLKGKIVDGDKSKYNGICFNCYIEDKEKRAIENKLQKEYLDEFGEDFIFEEDASELIQSKNFDKVAIIAFIP